MKMRLHVILITTMIAQLTLIGMAYSKQDTSLGKNSDNIITWTQPDFPPYIILKGKNKGKGIDNLIVQDISKKLDDYRHLYEECNYKRLQNMIKKKKQVLITPIFITPERQKFMIYSDVASYLVLPNGFIIRKRDKHKYIPYLSEDGELDIEKLINSENISIGINSGRSYSGILDEMINKYKDSGKFNAKSSSNLSNSMIKMLNAKRFDAILGFPVEMKYACEEERIDYTKFEIIPVKNMVSYSAVYFGAPQSEWGENVIKKINAFLKEPGTIAQYVSYYESWLDEKSKERYKKLLKEHYAEKYPFIYKTSIK